MSGVSEASAWTGSWTSCSKHETLVEAAAYHAAGLRRDAGPTAPPAAAAHAARDA